MCGDLVTVELIGVGMVAGALVELPRDRVEDLHLGNLVVGVAGNLYDRHTGQHVPCARVVRRPRRLQADRGRYRVIVPSGSTTTTGQAVRRA